MNREKMNKTGNSGFFNRLMNKISGLKSGQIPGSTSPREPLGFKTYYIKKEIEGEKFDFFIGDEDGRVWYHTGCTDPDWPEMRFIKEKMLRRNETVIECGFHHGCTTILLSRWVTPKGKIIGLEPNPHNFAIAERNMEINSIRNVRLYNSAAGSVPGKTRIDISSSNSHILENIDGGEQSVLVDCITLDSMNLKPDLIKIDVEGFEADVLKGAQKLLVLKPKLAIELHTEQLPLYRSSIASLFALLNRDDYHFWVQWEDQEMPIPYYFDRTIDKRVHLFGLPREI